MRKNTYSDWGELIEVVTAEQGIGDGGTDRRVIKRYDALRRLVHSEERNNGLTDSATARYYLYDAPVNVAPQVTATNVLGRQARRRRPRGR